MKLEDGIFTYTNEEICKHSKGYLIDAEIAPSQLVKIFNSLLVFLHIKKIPGNETHSGTQQGHSQDTPSLK